MWVGIRKDFNGNWDHFIAGQQKLRYFSPLYHIHRTCFFFYEISINCVFVSHLLILMWVLNEVLIISPLVNFWETIGVFSGGMFQMMWSVAGQWDWRSEQSEDRARAERSLVSVGALRYECGGWVIGEWLLSQHPVICLLLLARCWQMNCPQRRIFFFPLVIL